MKLKHYIIALLLIFFVPTNISAQDQISIPEGISIAFKAGNATELTKYMNSTIELLLLDKEDFYKKNVAETVLKDFFNSNQTKDFVIKHQGARNNAQYAIGSLSTEKGNYRVYFLLKNTNGQSLIHQIRIEEEK
ncbi:MAG: DUF4783 domain-containing protein [Bacteroidales bacterium]|nr:DUF4783 domain-containing protein [Bacteroidales bacterium]